MLTVFDISLLKNAYFKSHGIPLTFIVEQFYFNLVIVRQLNKRIQF